MARRTSVKLPGLTAWVENIKNTVSQETAREIVKDLQFLGPWYTGEFAKNWVVRAGQTSIGATKDRKSFFRLPQGTNTTKPGGRENMPGPLGGVPRPQGRKSIFYTIDNQMKYRRIAMDLDQEKPRFVPGRNNTAGQDWYILYVEGGLLRRRLEQETKRVANLPKIKGFKGTLTTRRELGI